MDVVPDIVLRLFDHHSDVAVGNVAVQSKKGKIKFRQLATFFFSFTEISFTVSKLGD